MVKDIKGSIVEAEDGTKADVKRIQPVHASSGFAQAGFALGDDRIQKKKDALVDLMALLYAWADEGERPSVSSAATHLRKEMGADYKATLQKTGFDKQGGPALAIRLFDNEFQVESGGYYFKKL